MHRSMAPRLMLLKMTALTLRIYILRVLMTSGSLIAGCVIGAGSAQAAPQLRNDGKSVVRTEDDVDALPLGQTDIIAVKLSQRAFEKLIERENIKHLTVMEGELKGVELFRRFSKLATLQSLVLDDFYRERGEWNEWSGLFPCLATLSLKCLTIQRCNRIADDWMRGIAQINSLEELSLDTCSSISSDAYTSLAALTSLESLSLKGAHKLGGSAAARLFRPLSKLNTLEIANCLDLSDSGVDAIAKLNRLTRLRLIAPSASTGRGLRALAALTGMKYLWVEHSDLTDKDVSAVVSYMALVECVVEGNLSGEFLIQTNKALRQLLHLHIWSTNERAEWSEAGLSSLLALPRLASIVLRGKGLCSDRLVSALVKMKAVVGVDLYEASSLTSQALKQLIQKEELVRLIVKNLESIDEKLLKDIESEFKATRLGREILVCLRTHGGD